MAALRGDRDAGHGDIAGGAREEPLMVPRGLFVGLTTLDLVQRVARAPGVDEKVVAQRSDLATGGPAAAAAVTFAALGGRAVLLSALGPGPIGRIAAQELAGCAVQLVDAWHDGADLSVSAITVVDGTGERSVVSRNAEDVRALVPSGLADLVADTDVVLIDGHRPELASAAAHAARAAAVPVLLDCGSAKPVYAELLATADAAICSAGFTIGESAGFAAVAPAVLAHGARVAAMTHGAAPVLWCTGEVTGAVPVPPVTVRDTLGAGDVLHGAAAFARARGIDDPERMLGLGVAVASVRVQHTGPRAWLTDERLAGLSARA
jgi:sugar/nucleoside kinase (ribokinase family)